MRRDWSARLALYDTLVHQICLNKSSKSLVHITETYVISPLAQDLVVDNARKTSPVCVFNNGIPGSFGSPPNSK